MARYITWADVVARYSVVGNQVDGADENVGSFINGAEAYINSKLAKAYTVPFSDTPELVKDLTIDLTYTKLGFGKLEDRKMLLEHVNKTLDSLVKGDMSLYTDSSGVIQSKGSGAWAENGSYYNTFDIDDPFNWESDPDRIDDIENRRD